MPTLSLSPSLTLHYLDIHPQGVPPVLLIHGLGATGISWEMQFPPLQAAGYRVLAPDMRGFGQSTYPGQMSIALMAADCAALLQSLTDRPAHVAGISMGGTIAQQLALDFPDLVDRLVLVNTFAQLKPKSLGVRLYFMLRMVLVHTLGLETQGKAVAQRIFPHPDQGQLRQQLVDQIVQANPRAYRAAMRALVRFDVVSRLNEIRSPTLVVTGEEDTTVPPENQRQLVEGIPKARQITFPGAGHAVIAEQPEAFNAALLGFLSGED